MSLLKSDLARNFTIGFALGAMMIGAQIDGTTLNALSTSIIPGAAAAVFS